MSHVCKLRQQVTLQAVKDQMLNKAKKMRCNTRQVNAFKRVHTLLDKASHNTIMRETRTATSVFFLMKSEGTQ